MDRLISADEIRVTAEMANLTLPEQEIPKLVDELSAILGYAQSLLAVDVTGVPPMTHAVPLALSAAWRCRPCARLDRLRDAQCPAKEASYFAVPAVFAGGDDGFDAEG